MQLSWLFWDYPGWGFFQSGCPGNSALTGLRHPTHRLLPRRRLELALFFQVVALLELPLPCIATENRVAMAVNAIDEVLAGHTHNTPFPALQVAVVDIIPILHNRNTTSVHPHYSSRGLAGKRLGGMSTESSLTLTAMGFWQGECTTRPCR